MFGINLGEFSVIALIALIVVGPERLPRYAQQLGRAVREGRRMAMGLREQVREELGPDFEDVDWRKLDPRQYDPRRIIREALTEAWEDEDAPVREPPRPRSGSSVADDAGARESVGDAVGESSATAETVTDQAPDRGSEPTTPVAAPPRQPAPAPLVTPYDLEAT